MLILIRQGYEFSLCFSTFLSILTKKFSVNLEQGLSQLHPLPVLLHLPA